MSRKEYPCIIESSSSVYYLHYWILLENPQFKNHAPCMYLVQSKLHSDGVIVSRNSPGTFH